MEKYKRKKILASFRVFFMQLKGDFPIDSAVRRLVREAIESEASGLKDNLAFLFLFFDELDIEESI